MIPAFSPGRGFFPVGFQPSLVQHAVEHGIERCHLEAKDAAGEISVDYGILPAVADPAKAASLLRWKPTVSRLSGIEKTLAWARQIR